MTKQIVDFRNFVKNATTNLRPCRFPSQCWLTQLLAVLLNCQNPVLVSSMRDVHTVFRGTANKTGKTKLKQLKPEKFWGCFHKQALLTWRSPSCSTSCRPSQSRCKFRPGTGDTPHTWGKRRATPDQAPLSRYTGRGSALHTPHRDSAAAFLKYRVPPFSVLGLPPSFAERICYTLFKKMEVKCSESRTAFVVENVISSFWAHLTSNFAWTMKDIMNVKGLFQIWSP